MEAMQLVPGGIGGLLEGILLVEVLLGRFVMSVALDEFTGGSHALLILFASSCSTEWHRSKASS